jgi:hypothetical protein
VVMSVVIVFCCMHVLVLQSFVSFIISRRIFGFEKVWEGIDF